MLQKNVQELLPKGTLEWASQRNKGKEKIEKTDNHDRDDRHVAKTAQKTNSSLWMDAREANQSKQLNNSEKQKVCARRQRSEDQSDN